MSAHFLASVARHPERSWTLLNSSTGQLVASTVIPAFDRRSRNEGLLHRSGLPHATALVLAPCSGVHTWFMRFPIDIVFVSRLGRVLGIRRNVPPWRLAIRLRAFAVIELRAGGADELEPGHNLAVASAPPTEAPHA